MRKKHRSPIAASAARADVAELAATLATDGYCCIRHLLTVSAAARARAYCDRLLRQRHHSVPPQWLLGLHQANQPHQQSWVSEIALHPVVGRLVSALLGERPALLSSQIFCKEPARDAAAVSTGSVPWHQDGASGGHSLALWVALDAVSETNGGLAVLPGLHARGRLPAEGAVDASASTFDRITDAALAPHVHRAVPYELPAGGVGIHGPWTPHHSPPNTSRRRRRVLVLRFVAARALAERHEQVWRMGADGRTDAPPAGEAVREARHQIVCWSDGSLLDRRAYHVPLEN